MTNALHEHWKLYLAEGIALIVLGIVAILLPPIATLAITIVLGWLFLISGVFGLYTSFMMRQAPGFWWSLISAALGIIVGALLLVQPLQGALSLTLVLIAFFVVEGVASIMFALDHKRELTGQWGWMLFSGLVDLVLAVLILTGLPGSAAWAHRASGRHQHDLRRLGAGASVARRAQGGRDVRSCRRGGQP